MFRTHKFSALRAAGVLAAMAVLVIPVAGSATTATGNMNVSALITKKCVVNITQPTANLAYDPFVNVAGTPLNDANGHVILNCTRGTGATIDMNAGLHSVVTNASKNQARMVDGVGSPLAANGDFLLYNVYQDSGHTTLWGTGSGDGTLVGAATASDSGLGPGTGNQFDHVVYLSIPGGQNPVVATFTDTMVATATY